MDEKLRKRLQGLGIEARSMTQEEAEAERILIYYGPGSEALSKTKQRKSEGPDDKHPPQNPQEYDLPHKTETEKSDTLVGIMHQCIHMFSLASPKMFLVRPVWKLIVHSS